MVEELPSRDALIAAALAGDSSEGEHRRFVELYESDAGVREEFDGARALMERMDRAGLSWSEPELPAGLAERVRFATSAPGSVSSADSVPSKGAVAGRAPDGTASASVVPLHPVGPRRRSGRRGPDHRFSAVALGAAAASALMVGALGTVAISRFADVAPEGPPGTLGAVETVDFSVVPEDAELTASLVAHTWGTETVLEIDGLPVGGTFEVVLTREDGQELLSGTFLGSTRTVTCSMNAAVLREDVSEVEIRDEDGAVVASALVPDV